MTTDDRSPMWAALRAPFPAEQILKLPKPTSRDNAKGKCNECGGWHGLPAVHLDYVGHAEVTDRLLSVDPLWNWEPVACDESGLPKFVMAGGKPVGLWIRLTVGGVTRLGYGSVEPGVFDAEKQLIGDAIRNSSMRFGVALDLWAKSDLYHDGDDAPPPPKRGHLAQTARDLGAEPAEDRDEWANEPARTQASATPTDPAALYRRVTDLMGSERVTSAAIKAVLGEFSRDAVVDWIAAEPGRSPETLIATAKRGGGKFE